MHQDQDDINIDTYHDGYRLFLARQSRPACPIMAEGWDDANRANRVRVEMPNRPEGYYHMPLGE
jgi:hypothetical protein